MMISLIREENYAQTMREVVEPRLAALREEIDMPLDGGGALHAELYEQEGAKRAVVILHGYTESGEKFREMTWYFLQQGFNVFVPDHRGHGRSVRQMEETWLTHVDHFDDYVHDLEQLMDRVVLPRAGEKTLCLYAHSMGGAAGAMALIRHPEWFARAVLTAPMIAPSAAPLPGFIGKALADVMCALGKQNDRAFIGKPFDPANETFEASYATSRARFDYYEQKRIANKHLQNCAPTYGWVKEAIGVTKVLLDPENDKRIATPVLLCQAGRDTIVCLPEQRQFVEQVSGAQLRVFETAKHEIYCSDDEVMRGYLDVVLGFLTEA